MIFSKKVIAIFIFYSLIFSLSAPVSAWWDPEWQYRKPIIINGSTSALTNYQVLVDLTSSNFDFSKANAQGNDIRFIWLNGSIEQNISFWIVNWTSSGPLGNASIWIDVPNITASSIANTTVYMYYSNPSAASASNESATFYISNRKFDFTPLGRNWTCKTAGPGACNTAYSSDYSSSPNSGYVYETSRSCGFAHLQQNITLPDISPLYLHYNRKYWCNTWGLGLGIKINATSTSWSSGTTLHSWGCGGSSYSSPWAEFWDDISAYKGKTVLLEIYYHDYTDNDASWCSMGDHGAWLRVDDLSITTINSNPSYEPIILEIGEQETDKKIKSIKTYIDNTIPESYFSNGTNITIEINGTDFSSIPTITITDNNNTVCIDSQAMVNISNTFYYNYTINSSSGWYDITIDKTVFENVFYQGDLWLNNWTDADSNIFPFRIGLNLSSQENRFFEPLDIPVSFLYGANNRSIRLVRSNGTDLLEVPSQIYNLNQTGNDLNSANLVFLSTTGNQNRTYYIYYSKADYDTVYTSDMNVSNTSDTYQIENSYYTTVLNKSYGGLMQYAKDKYGTDTTLAGLEPMDYYPEFRVQYGSTYTVRDYIYPQVTVETGPIMTYYKVTGNMQDSTNPYNLSVRFYSKNPYFIIDKSFTQTVSRYWDYMFESSMRYKDGTFSGLAYKNSSANIITKGIAIGDNSDYLNLDNNMSWLAVYNNITFDGMADIFLDNNYSIESGHVIDFIDRGDYDFYVRKIISSTTSIPANPIFRSTTARMIYNGLNGYTPVEDMYAQLSDPINTSLGIDETYDEENPNYNLIGNISANDTENITCYSYWTDDSYLNYAEINITGPGNSGNGTIMYYNPSYSIRNSTAFTNESWVNITLSNINAGTFNCTIAVYDISGKSNTTSTGFTVKDVTAPTLENISSYPATEANLDPDKTITITVDITEYTETDTVILYYRSNQTWNSTIMQNISESYYTKTYEANFTPGSEANYTYYIYTNDTDGNEINSTETNLSIFYDWTWTVEPFDFGTVSGSLETNVTVGNITINNTGDKLLTFRLTSDWEDKSIIYFNDTIESDNGFELSISPHNSTNISLIVKTKTTERSDNINIQVSAVNASAAPAVNTLAATIVSYASGPFMYITITEYNSTMTQGDTGLIFQAKVQNKGNETANNSWLAWVLPSGWTITSGVQNISLGNLTVDALGWNSIVVSVSDSADIGTKMIIAMSGTSYSENKTRSVTKEVIVAKKSEIITKTITTKSPGVGGSSGSITPGLSTAQKNRLFQTSETFELVRGKDNNFSIYVENPFEDGNLEDIALDITGYMSQYIDIVPDHLDSMSVGDSHEFVVFITAPKYFTVGNYWLNFTITGVNRDISRKGNATTEKITIMVEHRSILLKIHDLSRDEAEQLIYDSTKLLSELDGLNISTKNIDYLINTSISALESGDYEGARDITEMIRQTHNQITQTISIIDQLNIGLKDIHIQEIDTPGTDRILSLVQFALDRGDYETALSRAKEAQMTYALETKGVFNPIYFIKSNKQMIAVTVLGLIALFSLIFLMLHYWSLNHWIKMLKKEENILIGLMKEVQHECFDNAKMSLEEFEESMLHYEKKLGKVVSNLVKAETKKAHFFKFQGKIKKINYERVRLLDLIRQTQKEYMEDGTLETRIYENRLKSLSSRLSEIEEKFALIEARKALGKNNRFLRLFNIGGGGS